jgi:hypothetical protein
VGEALNADAFRVAADRGYDVIQLFGANLFRHGVFMSFDSAWQYRSISRSTDHIVMPNKVARNPILFGAIPFRAETLNGCPVGRLQQNPLGPGAGGDLFVITRDFSGRDEFPGTCFSALRRELWV